MTTMKVQKKVKSCSNCMSFGYIKDDRLRSIVCAYGDNYDFRLCQYTDKGAVCKNYIDILPIKG